jgi:uncharacterized protein (TIGR03435 family)
MFQSLLAERFKLKVRKETKITPMFALVLARNDGKLGPRLRASEIEPVRCSLQYLRKRRRSWPTAGSAHHAREE